MSPLAVTSRFSRGSTCSEPIGVLVQREYSCLVMSRIGWHSDCRIMVCLHQATSAIVPLYFRVRMLDHWQSCDGGISMFARLAASLPTSKHGLVVAFPAMIRTPRLCTSTYFSRSEAQERVQNKRSGSSRISYLLSDFNRSTVSKQFNYTA